jgi:hypothetical protein
MVAIGRNWARQVDGSSARKAKAAMPDIKVKLDFNAPAALRKWPSLSNQRVSELGARPYLVLDGTLDECIRQFLTKPASQHHL